MSEELPYKEDLENFDFQAERTFEYTFDKESELPIPFEGTLRKFLATLTSTLLTSIPVRSIAKVSIYENGSITTDQILAPIVSRNLIFEKLPNDVLTELRLYVTAPLDSPLHVYSDSIQYADGNSAPVIKGIRLTTLHPGQTLYLKMLAKTATSSEGGIDFMAVQDNITFRQISENKFLFRFTVVDPRIDPDKVLQIAYSKMDPAREKEEEEPEEPEEETSYII